jgi:hypothetical protein
LLHKFGVRDEVLDLVLPTSCFGHLQLDYGLQKVAVAYLDLLESPPFDFFVFFVLFGGFNVVLGV